VSGLLTLADRGIFVGTFILSVFSTRILEAGLNSIVWGSVVLSEVEVHEALLVSGPVGVSELGNDTTVLSQQVGTSRLLVIVMFNEGQGVLAQLKGNLGSTIELSVQGLSVKTSL